jgi:CRISPR-associated endonuclease/helicase Cas3
MKSTQLLAHPEQSLADHLSGVAQLAESFADWFGASNHGKIVGLLHDLGKAEDVFQTRTRPIQAGKKDPGDKQPHAHHGASLALAQDHWPVAFSVNGHHAGLHNRSDLAKRADYQERAKACLERLKREGFSALSEEFGPILPNCFENLGDDPQRQMMAVELFTRFLFSALVDADRLDTERSDPEARQAALDRKAWRAFDATELFCHANQFIMGKRREPASLAGREQAVQRVRDEVADRCRTGGDNEGNKARGLFSLTVPTGGGKTLASMLFALSHAKANGQEESGQNETVQKPMRRIIVVIPYLSIIQQTAAVLKEVFNHTDESPVILEHHSNAADPALDEKKLRDGKTSDYSRTRTLRQLAAENWDAPIVVTTSVQFFDSLFSRRPADARKLHNLAHSVIIFDEVQTLPPHLLQPILDVLGELTHPERPYGCSAIFCTATQPALNHDESEFPVGLKNVRSIIPSETATKHFNDLKRVDYSGIQKDVEPEILTAEQVAERTTANARKQCLVVVNTRKSARQAFGKVQAQAKAMGSPDAVFHLSTWMIPAHRLQVLEEVRRRLAEDRPCFLVSTQCIEAGVDVDFPEVWRAYGPYDSIVQAAGRCNREGKLSDLGKVHVFRLEGDDPEGRSGIYGTATAQMTLLRKMDRAHPEDPTSFSDYFRLLYQISVPDECLIQQNRAELRFEEVSKLFNFIESFTTPVLIVDQILNGKPNTTEARAIYEAARKRPIPGGAGYGWFTRDDWRRLQPFILNLDYRNKTVQTALSRYTHPVFDSDEMELRIWDAGSAGYIGGINGTGINFDNLDQTTADLLTGGL